MAPSEQVGSVPPGRRCWASALLAWPPGSLPRRHSPGIAPPSMLPSPPPDQRQVRPWRTVNVRSSLHRPGPLCGRHPSSRGAAGGRPDTPLPRFLTLYRRHAKSDPNPGSAGSQMMTSGLLPGIFVAVSASVKSMGSKPPFLGSTRETFSCPPVHR